MNLFEPLQIRELKLKNRIAVSPMCMYSAEDGVPNDWHLVHLGARAVGGAALCVAEASAVTAEGRITPDDTGIYSEKQVEAWARIVAFLVEHDCIPGIQLAHAGRKASMSSGWKGGKVTPIEKGGWANVYSAGDEPFAEGYPKPIPLDEQGINETIAAFRKGAENALRAGFQVAEIHAAHGYLLHQFYSPLSNHRSDRYGGSFENRIRLTLEVTEAVREVWPQRLPLFLRLSATDWTDDGWDLDQSIELARRLKPMGVDLIDCSSGGNLMGAKIPTAPGYQVPFAESIRREAGVMTGAVGQITDPKQADRIIREGQADLVLLARELLRDPNWPLRAAQVLGAKLDAPVQYARAWPS